MIEIDVKLIPYGIRDREHLIARMTIWNDATGDYEIGNYGYKIDMDDARLYEGEYKNFKRREGILSLVRNILNDIEE